MKKNILRVMLGSIILEVILVCMFILIGSFNHVAWHSLGSIAIIFGYSIPCLLYSKVYDNEKYRYVAIIGSIIVCIAAFLSILELWDIVNMDVTVARTFASLNVIVWALAFISWVLSVISVNNLLSLFKKISVSLISVLSLFTIIFTWNEDILEGFLLRLYWVLIVSTIGSFICTLILTRIYKKEIIEASKSEEIPTVKNNLKQQTKEEKEEKHSETNENSDNDTDN